MLNDSSDSLEKQNHFRSDAQLRQEAELLPERREVRNTSEYHGDLEMTVGNIGYMIDRIGQDCAPDQFLRELTQNSIQAIERTPEGSGQIIWDYHQPTYLLTGVKKLCIIDTGIGMSGPEMIRYINSAFRSSYEQGHDKNFGIGAKVAAATRNPHGLLYMSWKNSRGAMVILRKNPYSGQYGLEQHEVGDGIYRYWAEIDDDMKPEEIADHGTVVVLLGDSEDDDTFQKPKGLQLPMTSWVATYLNSRYFRIPEGITIKAAEHVPKKDRGEWRRTVTGQEAILERTSAYRGSVGLDGARAHWWILSEDYSSRGGVKGIYGGHTAALYQNEIYEALPMNRGGFSRLQMFGVVLGYNRVVIYIEPRSGPGRDVVPDTARTRLILNEEPLPWSDWAAEFREKMPAEIREMMEEYAARSTGNNDREAIKKRIEELWDLYRPSRYKPSKTIREVAIEEPNISGSISPEKNLPQDKQPRSGGTSGRTGHKIYSAFIKEGGDSGQRIYSLTLPEVIWVSVENKTRDPHFMEDAAAHYTAEAHLISINADFRIFNDLIDHLAKHHPSVPGGRAIIKDRVKREVESALIETVLTFQSMSGSKEWPEERIAKALSEEGLTAAVMPRQHIYYAVESELRKLGSKAV